MNSALAFYLAMFDFVPLFLLVGIVAALKVERGTHRIVRRGIVFDIEEVEKE